MARKFKFGLGSHSSRSLVRVITLYLRRISRSPRTLITLLIITLAFNWLIFGNTLQGPFASKPPENKLMHLLNPSYLNMLKSSRGFQGQDPIEVDDLVIAPQVDGAQLLSQLRIDNLFKTETINDKKRYLYTSDFFTDAPKPPEGGKSWSDAIQMVRSDFRTLGRKVYKGKKNPPVVLVLGLDFMTENKKYLKKVLDNRSEYAKAHGYGVYARWIQEFTPRLQETANTGTTWWRPLLMMEAINAFPQASFFWFLTEDALIVKTKASLQDQLLNAKTMKEIMLKDQPIALPESAIKTYRNLKPEDVSFILSQDSHDLCSDSMLVKNDMYGRVLLQYWGDQLFRQYANFVGSEIKGLSHILQWHPSLLAKTSLVSPRAINSLHLDGKSKKDPLHNFEEGDLVVNFGSCTTDSRCLDLAKTYWKGSEKDDEK